MSQRSIDRQRIIDNAKAIRKLKNLRYSLFSLVLRDRSILRPAHFEYLSEAIHKFDEMMLEYKPEDS